MLEQMLFPSEPFAFLCTLAFGISQALVCLRPPAQLMEVVREGYRWSQCPVNC